jgi:hypothetical protein
MSGRFCNPETLPWNPSGRRSRVAPRASPQRPEKSCISNPNSGVYIHCQVKLMMGIHILERDNWTCQLCGVATHQSLRGTIHPHAPEIDHKIPRSRGGSDEDSNLRCACRCCNNERKRSFLDSEFKVPEYGEVTYDATAILEATRAIREGGAKGGRNGRGEAKVKGALARKLAMDENPEIRARCLAGSSKGFRNQSREARVRGGRIRGLRNSHEHLVMIGRMGAEKGAVKAAHVRWHVNRNIVSAYCDYCV